MRLFQSQIVLEDDRKLCEYSLPEGATISALFEPEADINIEVSTVSLTKKLTVSNTTSVMALKSQICNAFKYAVQFKTMQLRFGNETLDHNLPLHFYGITDGSKLEVLRPYIGVRIENNLGNAIYWRLHRRETIREIKVKLASAKSASSMNTRKRWFNDYEDLSQRIGALMS